MPRRFGDLFLGVGAMKAGTTWLYAALNRHPQLFFTTEKELHYFFNRYCNPGLSAHLAYLKYINDRILRPRPEDSPLPPVTRAERLRTNLHWIAAWPIRPLADPWYARLFAQAPPDAWHCDFSNLSALLPAEAWTRIAGQCDRLRVLYTMRNPVERLWSQTRFNLQMQGMSDQAGSWGADEFSAFVRRPQFWAHAEYGAVLRRLHAGLPGGCLKPVIFEQLHADPRAGLAEIETFLDIPPGPYPRWLMTKRINATPEVPVPGFFADLVAQDVTRILHEVTEEGIAVPAGWWPG
ncbi:MAG: sulfotransferase [Rhodobacter sp.]|nr:sulfotransferase [Rhodobacter sp.]